MAKGGKESNVYVAISYAEHVRRVAGDNVCVLYGARAIRKEPSSRLGSDQNTLRYDRPEPEAQ